MALSWAMERGRRLSPEAPWTKPGDLWVLGQHRLLCGDARDPAALARVPAGGRADVLWTDPPYPRVPGEMRRRASGQRVDTARCGGEGRGGVETEVLGDC